MAASFGALHIRGWRQFGAIDIEFHPRLTVLTGVNGTGKTTILKLLAAQFTNDWPLRFTATASSDKLSAEFSSDGRNTYFQSGLPGSERTTQGRISVGSLVQMPKGSVTLFSVPSKTGSQYELIKSDLRGRIEGDRTFGFYLPSHRSVASYASISQIPTNPYSPQVAFLESVVATKGMFADQNKQELTPHQQRKRALIAMHAFPQSRFGSAHSGLEIINTFQNALRLLLPKQFKFKQLQFRGAEVVVQTERGEFSMDSFSGGLESIVDLAWHCSLISSFSDSFGVVLDEPENHLHPEMQRSIIPSLLDAFESAQIVVATHNPLVATSAEFSSLYFLDFDESGFVTSTMLDDIPKTGSSNETLRSFFGVSSSMPIWVEERLEKISKKYSDAPMTEGRLEELRKEMEELSLDEYIPETLVRSIEQADE